MSEPTDYCKSLISELIVTCLKHNQKMKRDDAASWWPEKSRVRRETFWCPANHTEQIVRSVPTDDHLPPMVAFGGENPSKVDESWRPRIEITYDPEAVSVQEPPEIEEP